MASPLSPLGAAGVNMRSPMTARRNEKADFEDNCATPSKHEQSEVIDWDDDVGSSPFVADAEARAASREWRLAMGLGTEADAVFEDPTTPEARPSKHAAFGANQDKENMGDSPAHYSPKKSLSPLKVRPSSKNSSSGSPSISSRAAAQDAASVGIPPSTKKIARFTSPRRTFNTATETPLPRSRHASIDDSIENVHHLEDITAPDVDDTAAIVDETNVDDTAAMIDETNVDDTAAIVDETNVDDTCFSTFSVIPEMTLFANMGDADKKSPLKDQHMDTADQSTPRPNRKRPSPSRSPSPTHRRLKTPAADHLKTPATDKTNNSFLIDFTQQIERFSNADYARHPRSPTKSSTEPNLLSYLNNQRSPGKSTGRMSTPAKSNNLLNLLDFELPPAPTPRSVPSISIRELESMKSTYQSHISSLKATLTGREAEVESLKKAVADAERRVGESLEESRNEKSKREHAEHEKEEWEKRGKEVENLLNSVREEVFNSEAEKEDLCIQADENKRRAEDAEARLLDMETQLASARAALPNSDGSATGIDEDEVQRLVQARIDAKIEAVSRELHSVYKKKHETKVATLKKSYEARSEKKCAELLSKVGKLSKQNEELQAARDSTFTNVLPEDSAETRRAMEEQRVMIDEQRAQIAGMTEEIEEVRSQHSRLARELEQERIEKGELVAAVDEMLVLQSTDSGPAAIEDFRKSIQRPSVARPAKLPAFGSGAGGESRIGKTSGLARPSAGKSKMMSNIERMGGGGRNVE